MTQLDFGPLLDVSGFSPARSLGEAAASAAIGKAERHGFDTEGCRAFILRHLQLVDRCSGEDLTDLAKASGFRPEEDRAFGSVFASLVRKGLIRCVGYTERRKGHGCSGGRIWAAVR